MKYKKHTKTLFHCFNFCKMRFISSREEIERDMSKIAASHVPDGFLKLTTTQCCNNLHLKSQTSSLYEESSLISTKISYCILSIANKLKRSGMFSPSSKCYCISHVCCAGLLRSSLQVDFNSLHHQIDLNYMIMQIVCLLCSAHFCILIAILSTQHHRTFVDKHVSSHVNTLVFLSG